MESDVIQCKLKTKRLLNLLLDVNCQICLERSDDLLSCVSQLESTEVKPVLNLIEDFTRWIKHAVTTWNATRATPRTSIMLFTTSLAGLLSRNEERFCDLKNDNFFIKLFTLLKRPRIEQCVKLSYVKLLTTFLEHKSGVEFIISSHFWEDIFGFLTLKNDIFSECVRFVSKILEKTIDYDENFCNSVMKQLILPLGENISRSPKSSVCGKFEDQQIHYSLKLLRCVLEHFMEEICFRKNDFGVLFIFLDNFHPEERISHLLVLAQNKNLVSDLSRIMFIVQLLELYVKLITNTANTVSINLSINRIKNKFLSSIYKETFDDIIEFARFGLLYWKLVDLKFPNSKTNDSGAFSNQLVAVFVLPQYCLMLKHCLTLCKIEEKCLTDDFRDVFIGKMFKMLGDTTRLHFGWRDRLIASPNLFRICEKCWILIKDCRKYFSRYQAVTIFQTLTYLIKDLIWGLRELPHKIDLFQEEQSYILQIFELLVLFIDEFQITWKDSVEAIDVMNVSFDFLALNEWGVEVVVQVLKLVNVATAKYMSPSLALLLDSSGDSSVALLGYFLCTKLGKDEAGVKKEALEVVRTMADLSRDKFPSLQKVLMDSELPTLVVKMSTCDGESFVRATAIKCLQEMIQVEEIWNNALRTEDLSQKMRDVLLNETEGIVRVEAATFMCVAYEHGQFPRDTIDSIYETMIYSSTTDLHWEVKVRALNFWDKVIKNHLQNQGMIDGSFPNVTFSKEHRKIVTLTDSEIRKRLLKVLSQLSSIGCLGVLTSAIKDDCDMEVSKTAVKITQKLIDLLKKYNVRSNCSAPTSPLPTENGMSATVSMSSGISVDESMDSPGSGHPDLNEEIIEQIVNSKDVNLLKNVYTPSDYGSVSNYDIQVRKIITPDEFLQFTQQDLNNIITEKKKWLNGIEDLGSLLDDMLKTYEDDVNNMDCY